MKKEDSRFRMTKSHHRATLEKAVEEGKIDKDFEELCRFISGKKGYFTSSSCAGRISLMELNVEEKKAKNAFYRKWHRQVGEKEVQEAVDAFKGDFLWLKQDPLILHVGAKDLEHAKKIIGASHKAGIKRAMLMTIKEGRYVVEILGSKNVSSPVKSKEFQASEEYLRFLTKIANSKFKNNQELLKRLEKAMREEL